MTNNQCLSTHELIQKMYNLYNKELYNSKLRNETPPLYLFSVRVFSAYNNCWRIVNRDRLTPEEVNIIHKLGCYKPSRTELGTRWLKPIRNTE